MTTEPNYDELTDWPNNETEASADRMIVHSIRQASFDREVATLWMRAASAARDDAQKLYRNRQYIAHLESFISSSQTAWLLAAIQKVDAPLADEFAAKVFSATEDGGYFDEMGWEWLDERGIDADGFYVWAKSIAALRFDAEQEVTS